MVPLDSTASIFAPLLALDGTLRSWQRRNRLAMSPLHRALALLSGLFPVLAVAAPDPTIAWLAILAAILTARLPTMTRRWDDTVLAILGAGIALFGLVAPAGSILGALQHDRRLHRHRRPSFPTSPRSWWSNCSASPTRHPGARLSRGA